MQRAQQGGRLVGGERTLLLDCEQGGVEPLELVAGLVAVFADERGEVEGVLQECLR
ncbi:hypothetical protein D3C83_226070 [compost metagenome]